MTESKTWQILDDHRSYVGPKHFWDIAAAQQFSVLVSQGMRAKHKVLDVGCGSLRLGRLLIPWLNDGCYFGVEPNEELVLEGMSREVPLPPVGGVYNSSIHVGTILDIEERETKFDYVLFHSIFTHASLVLTRKMLIAAESMLAPDGMVLATYLPGPQSSDDVEWVYPTCRTHSMMNLAEAFRDAGLNEEVMDSVGCFKHFHGHEWVTAKRA